MTLQTGWRVWLLPLADVGRKMCCNILHKLFFQWVRRFVISDNTWLWFMG